MTKTNSQVTAPHAGMGRFIAWLQREILVDNRRLTNAAICNRIGMSTGTYNNVKKGC